jgi:cysteine desulfurase
VIYLDHNAITPMRPEALSAAERALRTFGNPSSVHAAGRAARDLLDGARGCVARALSARAAGVVFTSGATEAAAMAIRGALATAPQGRRGLVVSAVEHPCVLDLARELARDDGVPVQVVPVDRQGVLDVEALGHAVSSETALLACMLANNETGVLQPVAEVAEVARRAGAPFLCDAVQAVGKVPVEVGALGADLVAITGQKFGGPRGAGALWVREGLRLRPLFGGHQERGRRAGTENLPGVAGLGAAIEAAGAARGAEAPRMRGLRDRLEAGLLAAIPRTRVNGAGAERLPSTASVTFEGCDSEALLIAMDLEGICASAGAACTSGSTKPSHVLTAMGLSAGEARATIRFSVGWSTTAEEVEAALRIVPPLVERVRREIPMP